jgi:hypothetical protein
VDFTAQYVRINFSTPFNACSLLNINECIIKGSLESEFPVLQAQLAEVQTAVNTNNTFILPTTIEYPPSAMTQNTQALTGGTYTASGSSASNANLEPYKAFNRDAASQWLTLVRYDATTGVYTGAATTLVGAVSVSGEWLQLTMPTADTIFSVVIQATSFGPNAEKNSPRDFVVAAFVDGAWTEVLQRVGVNDWGGGVSKSFVFDSTRLAAAYRIIIQRVGNFNSSTFQSALRIAEVRFIAYEVGTLAAKLSEMDTRLTQMYNDYYNQPV